MARKKSILENLKENEKFHFFGGSTFIRYPQVQASDAVLAFNNARQQVFARMQQNQDINLANQLENFLNQMVAEADFEKQLNKMAEKIINRMDREGIAGVEAGIDSEGEGTLTSKGIGLKNGMSYGSIKSSAKQALKVYESGQKNGKQYTNITGARGGGTYDSYKINSAYDFLHRLNEGLMTPEEINNMAMSFKDIGNLNGELLERVVEIAGNACFAEGAKAGAEVTKEVMDSVLSMIGNGNISKKTAGQLERHVQLDLGEKEGAIVYDSQGKTDIVLKFPSSDISMNISAKSVGKFASEVKLLTEGNLMGLLAGSGAATKQGYSALTVYTGGAVYSENGHSEALDGLKKMLIAQALSGTTGESNDLANYMVFQVGDSGSLPHFKVVPMSFFINGQNLNQDIDKYAKLTFIPNPLPIGANTYIEKQNGILINQEMRYPRTQATLDKLFEAKVSIVLRSGYLKGLYGAK